jgi:hypothetical protein
MTSVYHIVTIHENETSWAHVWRLRFRYLGTGYDIESNSNLTKNSNEVYSNLKSKALTQAKIQWRRHENATNNCL